DCSKMLLELMKEPPHGENSPAQRWVCRNVESHPQTTPNTLIPQETPRLQQVHRRTIAPRHLEPVLFKQPNPFAIAKRLYAYMDFPGHGRVNLLPHIFRNVVGKQA